MWLALETASEVASVAVGLPGVLAAEASLAGPRRHAGELVGMVQATLAAAGCSIEEIEGVVVAEGPGSFTGLRVGASMAKALVRSRGLALWTAPSLVVMAGGAGAEPGGLVLALTDALRGEVYSAAYRIWPGRIEVALPPAVRVPDARTLADLQPERVSAFLPAPLIDRLPRWPAATIAVGPSQAPRAGTLLSLIGRAGGTQRVAAPGTWEPDYGRPAEAQARWEAEHGRRLPHSSGIPG